MTNNDIEHEVWIDGEGKSALCFAGDLGTESRNVLEKDAVATYSFVANSHYDAMTKYYQFMNFGTYETEFQIDKEPYDLNKLKRRARIYLSKDKIYDIIDRILWIDWDPLGISDVAPKDEYYAYIPEVYRMLLNNSSILEISNALYEIETKTMGLFGNRDTCNRIANQLIKEIE